MLDDLCGESYSEILATCHTTSLPALPLRRGGTSIALVLRDVPTYDGIITAFSYAAQVAVFTILLGGGTATSSKDILILSGTTFGFR